jgi:hypothetical protein
MSAPLIEELAEVCVRSPYTKSHPVDDDLASYTSSGTCLRYYVEPKYDSVFLE